MRHEEYSGYNASDVGNPCSRPSVPGYLAIVNLAKRNDLVDNRSRKTPLCRTLFRKGEVNEKQAGAHKEGEQNLL
jgi:hypothetical protein